MRAVTSTAWEARRRPTDVVALLFAAVYVAAVTRLVLGTGTAVDFVLLPLPLLLLPVLFARHRALPPAKLLAVTSVAVALGAYIGAFLVFGGPGLIIAIPALLLAGVAATRRPAAAIGILLFCAGAFGSLDALVHIPAAKVIDVVLVGLWLAAGWAWYFGGNPRSGFTPALAALAAYVLLTACSIFLADNVTAGIQSFRSSIWYLAVVLLAAYAPWSLQARRRMLRLAALVGLAIGGYATLRWAIGPADAERALAEAKPNNLLDGELRPVGSFATAKELAFWTAITTPFMVGLALVWRDRWRLVAGAAAVLCIIGMLAADVRAAPAGAVPGTVLVLGLYQLSQGFRGRRGPSSVLAILVCVVAAVGAFTITLADKPDTASRYENILSPTQDASYQARLLKWRAVLADIDEAPLGHGLGTAGRAQERYGTTVNINNFQTDNSYLKVAYEQGFVVMVLLGAILLALLALMCRRALTEPDPARAGPAIAACGTFTAMLIIFYVGDYIEGLPALGGWILVGLGLSCSTRDAQASA